MLVLMRRTREEIVIAEERITIKVLQTHGNRVSIGIAAPPEVSVRRSEISLPEPQSPLSVDRVRSN